MRDQLLLDAKMIVQGQNLDLIVVLKNQMVKQPNIKKFVETG